MKKTFVSEIPAVGRDPYELDYLWGKKIIVPSVSHRDCRDPSRSLGISEKSPAHAADCAAPARMLS
jgi:hypothetical protein